MSICDAKAHAKNLEKHKKLRNNENTVHIATKQCDTRNAGTKSMKNNNKFK